MATISADADASLCGTQDGGDTLNEPGTDEYFGGTSVDSSHLIQLMRVLLVGCDTSKEHGTNPVISSEATSQVAAGETLWDLSVSRPAASVLMHNHLLRVSEALLDQHLGKLLDGEADDIGMRVVELVVGILANVCTHDHLCSQVAERAELASMLLRVLWVSHPPCISELCRLLTTALQMQGKELWLRHVAAEPGWMPQLLLVVTNVLDTVCLERCLDAMVALLHVHAQQDSIKNDDVADGGGVPVVDYEERTQSAQPAHVTSQDNTDHELPSGCLVDQALQTSGSMNLLDRQVWMQVLDVVLQVLTIFIEQQVKDKSAEDSENSSSGSGSCQGQVAPAQTGTAYISSVCVDAALRVLEQVAANSYGKTLLQFDAAHQNHAQQEHVGVASGSIATMGRGIQGRRVGETLPSLLSQLLHCTGEVQVLESLFIVMVDCAELMLPSLAANPEPLFAMSNLVPEVTSSMQEVVQQTTWYLAAAALVYLKSSPILKQRGHCDGSTVVHMFEKLVIKLSAMPEGESYAHYAARCQKLLSELSPSFDKADDN